MPAPKKTKVALSTTYSLLSNYTYKSLIDPNIISNAWVQNDPNVIGNFSKVLLTGFYINYKQQLNDNINSLDEEIREESCDVLKETMIKNENEFLNTFNNILVTSNQKLEYLTSAIETSKVLLNSANDTSDPMSRLEGLFDASSHLFNRLNVYRLMPTWGVSVRVSHDVIQRWHRREWGNSSNMHERVEHEENTTQDLTWRTQEI